MPSSYYLIINKLNWGQPLILFDYDTIRCPVLDRIYNKKIYFVP